MHKHNDPRFWGKCLLSGAVATTAPEVGKIREMTSKLARGVSVEIDPQTRKFVGLRRQREELVHNLGRRIAGR